jgi:hypothetical protein
LSASLMGRRDDDKGGLPLIRCFCGTEILIVPSIEQMNRAIENHVKNHKRKMKDSKRAKEAEAQIIREFLSEQMFERIIERI